MSLAPDQIKSRTATAILNELGAPWVQSRHPYDVFGTLDGRQLEHKAFAIGLPATGIREGRQALSVGIPTTTAMAVALSFRLRADAAVADELLGLVAERQVVEAIREVPGNPQLTCRITGIRRRTLTDEAGHTLLCDIQAEVHHHYPLT